MLFQLKACAVNNNKLIEIISYFQIEILNCPLNFGFHHDMIIYSIDQSYCYWSVTRFQNDRQVDMHIKNGSFYFGQVNYCLNLKRSWRTKIFWTFPPKMVEFTGYQNQKCLLYWVTYLYLKMTNTVKDVVSHKKFSYHLFCQFMRSSGSKI